MRRLATAFSVLILAACAAPVAEPVSAFGGGDQSLVPPPTPAAEVAPPRTEAELRNDIAVGIDPESAALALVALLDAEERLTDALSVLAAAAARKGESAVLLTARAGVLRDLGRRTEAITELLRLQSIHPASFGPGLWFELAELNYLQGEREAAGSALRELRTHVDGARFVQEHDFEVRTLEQNTAAGVAARSVRVRDLLGDLRGAGDASRRLAVLEVLLRQGGDHASRACCIAVGDADPRVRSRGVAAAVVDPTLLAEFCAKALSDPDAPVRTAGAQRCAALPRDEAATLLLPVLAAESDPLAFSAMHAVLRELFGDAEPLSAAAAFDAARRAEVAARWQERFAR